METKKNHQKKLNTKHVVRIFLLVFASNLFILFLTQREVTPSSPKKIKRPHYTSLLLSAQLFLDPSYTQPVTITNKSRTFIIKNAFLLERKAPSSENTFNSSKAPLHKVDIPTSSLLKITGKRHLEIYPGTLNITLKKIKKMKRRTAYEINF